MPLRDVLNSLLEKAKKDYPVPATMTLQSGLEVVGRLDPPRLICSRTPTADGKNTFQASDPRSEKEGETCALQLGWMPWLMWNTHKDREYLTVCDRRLWYGLRDEAVIRLGPDTEEAIFLRYDINEGVFPTPVQMWEQCAIERWDSYTHNQLLHVLDMVPYVKKEKK